MTRRRTVVMLAAALGAVAACSTAPPPVPRPRPEVHAVRPPELRPEQLAGLSRDRILALFGPPAEDSTRGMATVWRYRRDGCAVSLVFYPEVATAVERVLSAEVEDGGADCLDRLHREHVRHGQ